MNMVVERVTQNAGAVVEFTNCFRGNAVDGNQRRAEREQKIEFASIPQAGVR